MDSRIAAAARALAAGDPIGALKRIVLRDDAHVLALSGPGDASHDGHGGVAGNIEWCPRLELMRRGEHVRILDPARRSERARGQQNIDSSESLIDRRYHLAPAFLRPKVVIG
jgi:hypothetical protein